ncbi:MAG: oxidoreductase [Rhodocyclales bacterium]|nr:oxidoreductase [Rhodocyclales bacterium]
MSQPDSTDDETLFANLQSLVESTFPKRCRNCGRNYATAAEFCAATSALSPDRSGLKQTYDEDGKPIVELFRNCVCGSTLMGDFHNRRDLSPAGAKRRQRFDDLLRLIQERGVDSAIARRELLKLMRGQKSELIGLLKATP